MSKTLTKPSTSFVNLHYYVININAQLKKLLLIFNVWPQQLTKNIDNFIIIEINKLKK